MEKNQKILRKIKSYYKQTEEVRCKGCKKMFNPTFFKAHVGSCSKLLADTSSFQEIAEGSEID